VQWLSRRPDAEQSWAWVATGLRIAAEAGFFATLYAALAVLLEGTAPLLGPIEFLLLVGLGAAVGRFGQSHPGVGAPLLVLTVLGAGIACWLASPMARGLFQDHFGAAVITHGIGWIGAFAALRGSLIRGGETGAFQLEQLLRTLLPFVAALWAVTTIFVARPLFAPFVAYALAGTLMLIVAGLAGIGLVRLRVLHEGVQETRVRRLWRWLVMAAAISVVPLAVPFAILSGVPVDVLLRPLVGPATFLLSLIIIPVGFFIDFMVVLLTPIASSMGKFLDELRTRILARGRPDFEAVPPNVVSTFLGVVIAAVVLLVIVFAMYLLARWLLTRQDDRDLAPNSIEGVVEHTFVVPEQEPARPRAVARRRRGAAHDAAAAYVSAIETLAAHPDWARAESETPAEHSSRMRESEMPGATDFSRLAADYQLARYAEVPITPREDRRALNRLDRLRRALRGI
jgi:hypothetical protein